MSGFMSSTTAMKVFEVQAKEPDSDKLRKYAFTTTHGPDGKRVGWVGLGDPLDQDFSFGIDFGRFLAGSTSASPPVRPSKYAWRKPSRRRPLPVTARFPAKGKRN